MASSLSPHHSRHEIEEDEMTDLNIEDMVSLYGVRTRTGYVPNKPHKVNQDSFFVIKNFGKIKNMWLMGVCDGHGSNGHHVSQFVVSELPRK